MKLHKDKILYGIIFVLSVILLFKYDVFYVETHNKSITFGVGAAFEGITDSSGVNP